MHNVGLIVDPGAAAGVLQPAGLASTFDTLHSLFAGIDGEAILCSAEVSVPIGMPGLPSFCFVGDVISNTGSICPALMPNSTIALFSNVFDNKDGILTIAKFDNHVERKLILFVFCSLTVDTVCFQSICLTKPRHSMNYWMHCVHGMQVCSLRPSI